MADLIRAAAIDCERLDEARVARAKRAGFDAIDLSVEPRHLLTTAASIAGARDLIQTLDARLVSVTLALPVIPGLDTGPGPCLDVVQRAARLLRDMRALDEPVLTIAPPPVVPPHTGAPVCAYQDAINLIHRALTDLAVEAERSGVTLAVRAPFHGSLLSPTEVRELIDGVSSPAVAACVDTGALAGVGRLDDWLDTLRRRIASLRVSAPGATANEARAGDLGADLDDSLAGDVAERCVVVIHRSGS